MDLSDKTQRAMLGYKLESQTTDEIDLALLKAYLEATEKYGNTTVSIRYQALKLKYEALNRADYYRKDHVTCTAICIR